MVRITRANDFEVAKAAEYYAHIGFRVLPLFGIANVPSGRCQCNQKVHDAAGKHPRIKEWQKHASRDRKTVRAWWARWPGSNVGMAMGGDERLVALDVDGAPGRESLAALEAAHGPLPVTLTSRSGRADGGEHRIFRCPEALELPHVKNRAGKIGRGLDARAQGGQIVVAPSVHKSGGRYAWTVEAEIAELPRWLYDLMVGVGADTPRARTTPAASERTTKYGRGALERAFAIVVRADEGTRNDTVNEQAFAIGQLVAGDEIDLEEARATLRDAANRQGAWPAKKLEDLLGRALEAGMKQPRRAPVSLRTRAGKGREPAGSQGASGGTGAPPPSSSGDGNGPAPDERTRIVVRTEEDEVTEEALGALVRARPLFRRGSALVTIHKPRKLPRGLIRDPDAPSIVAAPQARVREILSSVARFVEERMTRDGEVWDRAAHVPEWTVQEIMARGDWPNLRHLEAIVECPVLRPDGSVLATKGYDATTGLFLLDDRMPPVPEAPTRAQVLAAVELLCEVVCDFIFESSAHLAAWVASVLTPIARFAFRGPSPLFLIDATTPGTGKGLLADVVGLIALARPPARSKFAEEDDEMDKRILSWAMAGERVILLDNVNTTMGGASFENALTATAYGGRVLGGNTSWTGPLVVTWYATGNNVSISDDMHRRVCHVRLLSKVERPEERTDFKHFPLMPYVRAKRAELLCAALTILRGYHVAGRPSQGLDGWNTYEDWGALVREAVVWAGLDDPGKTRPGLRASADSRGATHARLFEGWARLQERLKEPAISAKRAIEVLFPEGSPPADFAGLRESVEELCRLKSGQVPSSTRVGQALKKLRGRVVAGLVLSSVYESHEKILQWQVVEATEENVRAAGTGGTIAGVRGLAESPNPHAREIQSGPLPAAVAQTEIDTRAREGEQTPQTPATPQSGEHFFGRGEAEEDPEEVGNGAVLLEELRVLGLRVWVRDRDKCLVVEGVVDAELRAHIATHRAELVLAVLAEPPKEGR
ncbi:MAG: bifunctional DNA primase/polymerase [Deltaproteobacteria bacterium]|nr:bifunctional DNA primase/polymerase [Deltaproteobacteria bacterium]